VRFDLLGPVTLTLDAGTPVALGGPRRRVLLATLLLHANDLVSTDVLADAVWDGAPPPGFVAAVRTHVMRLRHAVGPEAAARISTRSSGYLIRLDGHELDVLEFEALCREAGAAVRARSWDRASDRVTRALALWRARPLADVASQTLLDAWLPRLEGLHLQAREWRIEAELQLGHHDQVLPELAELAARHPLRENLYGQLMRALVRCGQRAQALDVYRDARRILVAELGVEPGAELRRLQERILAGDLESEPAGALVHQRPVPQQLPAAVRHFTGRAAELRTLRSLSAHSVQSEGGAAILVIGGTAGVGKTALALHWAHQAAHAFPDGRLYVDLRGYDDGEPVSAAKALAGFLRALGVAGEDIPAEADERAAEYRSLLAERRVLVILDNAREPEQVRPLLPGTASAVTLVTSRDALAGLVSRNGAQRLEVDLLPPADAVALLRTLIGSRVDAEPDAAAALVAQCCRLPLALRIAAELAATRPAVPLAALVGEMTDQRRRLDLLAAGGDAGTAVRSVFSWSYRHLEPAAARAFRLIGLHPGSDLEPYAVAALTSTTAEQANRLLSELERTHLIQAIGADRHGMHDLLRAYARELADTEDERDRRAALTGLFDHYLHTATAAMNTLFGAKTSRQPGVLPFAAALAPVADAKAAQAWLDAERTNLVAAAGHAADHGWPDHATRLSSTVERYLKLGQHLDEAITVHTHALRAARRSGDRSAEATALTHLGFVEWMRNRYEPAADYQRQALALFEKVGDWHGRARVLHRLALADRKLGRLGQAIEHAAQVLALCEQNGDRLGQARALQNLGITRREQGRFAQAADYQHRALAVFDELGDRIGQSATVKELGVIELRSGSLEPAADYFRQAVVLCRETGNPSGEAEAISQLGMVHLRRGHHEHATEHHERALAVFREISDRHGESEVLARLALADLRAGRHRQAIEHLDHALRLSRRISARPLETAVLNGLGEAYLAAGQPERAVHRHADALELAVQTGGQDEQARAHYGLAEAHAALGDLNQADRHRQAAIDLSSTAHRRSD
jgi:DNA-binding SARP family transcriptional activator